MHKLSTWGVGVLVALVVVSEASAQTIRDIAESVVQQRTSRRVQNHDHEMSVWFGSLVIAAGFTEGHHDDVAGFRRGVASVSPAASRMPFTDCESWLTNAVLHFDIGTASGWSMAEVAGSTTAKDLPGWYSARCSQWVASFDDATPEPAEVVSKPALASDATREIQPWETLVAWNRLEVGPTYQLLQPAKLESYRHMRGPIYHVPRGHIFRVTEIDRSGPEPWYEVTVIAFETIGDHLDQPGWWLNSRDLIEPGVAEQPDR